MPVIFPAHPRTMKTIETFGLMDRINGSGIEMLPPLPYMAFLRLWKDASLVLTDSGGLQQQELLRQFLIGQMVRIGEWRNG